jgi:hypothetical protein
MQSLYLSSKAAIKTLCVTEGMRYKMLNVRATVVAYVLFIFPSFMFHFLLNTS